MMIYMPRLTITAQTRSCYNYEKFRLAGVSYFKTSRRLHEALRRGSAEHLLIWAYLEGKELLDNAELHSTQ